MKRNPGSPIDFVKEPVHNQEKHKNRQQSRCSLNGERRHIPAEVIEDADSQGPSHKSCEEPDPYPDGHGASIFTPGSSHARGDRSKHQDTLQSLAENEHTNVEHCCAIAGL